ncbi:MAG TPA: hypothetical protein VN278_01225 [Methanosarcina sp.]|nr:hypothetical protein [Methanosarcina sp.]
MMAIIFTMSATTTTFTIPEAAESAWLVYMNSLETKLLNKKGLMFVFVKLLRFSVLVLIACDGDYVPLIRKLNTLGTRVMVLSWDFEYVKDDGQSMETRRSQDILEEVTYPVAMHEIIENRVRKTEPLINNLFVPQKTTEKIATPATSESDTSPKTSTSKC